MNIKKFCLIITLFSLTILSNIRSMYRPSLLAHTIPLNGVVDVPGFRQIMVTHGSVCLGSMKITNEELEHIINALIMAQQQTNHLVSRLKIYKNSITKLPDNIGKLGGLIELAAHNNKITHLPDSLKDCIFLQDLYLSNNKLAELPEFIGTMRYLNVLFISYNLFTTLPLSIGNLDHLANMRIIKNPFKSLPHTLFRLPPNCMIQLKKEHDEGKNPNILQQELLVSSRSTYETRCAAAHALITSQRTPGHELNANTLYDQNVLLMIMAFIPQPLLTLPQTEKDSRLDLLFFSSTPSYSC